MGKPIHGLCLRFISWYLKWHNSKNMNSRNFHGPLYRKQTDCCVNLSVSILPAGENDLGIVVKADRIK